MQISNASTSPEPFLSLFAQDHEETVVPISTRVAQYEWNKRRKAVSRVPNGAARREYSGKYGDRDGDDKRGGGHHQVETDRGSRTFAEVVHGNQKKVTDRLEEDYASLIRERGSSDRSWLEWCVVGFSRQSFHYINRPCPKSVKVSEGSRAFTVWVKKESTPVNLDWVSKVLHLKFETDDRRDDGPSIRYEDFKDGDVMGEGEERWVMTGDGRDVRVNPTNKDKGDLLKRRERSRVAVMKKGFKDDSCTSSTELSMEEGQLRNYEVVRGECSKAMSDGRRTQWAGTLSGDGQHKIVYSPSKSRGGFSFDSLVKGWDLDDEVAKVIEEGAALGYDFNGENDELEVEVSVEGESDKDNRIESSSHDDQEMKGEEKDEVGQKNNQNKVSKKLARQLEREVSKVVETGVALGFDFNSKEKEAETEIAKWEVEDEICLAKDRDRSVQ
ncbi:hypothetical protein Q3G72_001303 [Acer saccharum]|nr:hypothetical protein Q3G72_001303 [Acer saccharum]